MEEKVSKIIENLKSGNYEVVDNQGVSVTRHFTQCLEKEFADLEAKLAESEDCNNMLYKCLTEKDIEIETKKEENAELQKQLKETKADLFLSRNEIDTLKHNLSISQEHKKIIEEQYLEKCKELQSQPAEIVEKIKEFVDGNAYYYEEEQYAKHIIKYLDDILKEYQK